MFRMNIFEWLLIAAYAAYGLLLIVTKATNLGTFFILKLIPVTLLGLGIVYVLHSNGVF